jgi:hypothetical protein
MFRITNKFPTIAKPIIGYTTPRLVKRIVLGNLFFLLIPLIRIRKDLPANEKKVSIKRYLKIKVEKYCKLFNKKY